MRPATNCCAARQCPHLVWEMIGPTQNRRRGKRRRICQIAGTVSSYLNSCPSGLLSERVSS
ncbi:MAG: hypothetical protein LUQ50_14590 [Methanospirillum sp.]|uniref:hypothetical protein n=1 Tax=Methanospirillum sp. TaxID=45200 RepID=UPI00236C4E75|nr:hypothetical protein [Methanospirillum sp.]MDD1730281.1 hypothetical protein [Methanospirillum sp.]